MNTTNRYLDRLAAMQDGCSDYRLSLLLGATRQAVSKWRSEQTQLDDKYAMRLAELIRVDPIQVIAEIRAEREVDPDTRKLWRRMATMAEKYGHAAGVVLAILAMLASVGFSPSPLASDVNHASADAVQLCILCQVAPGAFWHAVHAALVGFFALVAARELRDTRAPHP